VGGALGEMHRAAFAPRLVGAFGSPTPPCHPVAGGTPALRWLRLPKVNENPRSPRDRRARRVVPGRSRFRERFEAHAASRAGIREVREIEAIAARESLDRARPGARRGVGASRGACAGRRSSRSGTKKSPTGRAALDRIVGMLGSVLFASRPCVRARILSGLLGMLGLAAGAIALAVNGASAEAWSDPAES